MLSQNSTLSAGCAVFKGCTGLRPCYFNGKISTNLAGVVGFAALNVSRHVMQYNLACHV